MSNDGPNPSERPGEGTSAYTRPDGVAGSFEQLATPPSAPAPNPPVTPSPGEQAAFGRPAGVDGGFVQRPGQPRPPAAQHVTPPPYMQQAFGRPSHVPGSFAPHQPHGAQRYTQAEPPLAYQKAFGRPDGQAEDLQRRPGAAPYQPGAMPSKTWWEEAPRDPWRDPHAEAGLVRAPRLAEADDPSADAAVQSDKKGRRRIRLGDIPLRIAALVATMTLILGVAGGVAGYFLGKVTSQTPLTTASPSYHKVDNTKPPSSIGEIAEQVQPSVVSIDVLVGNTGGTGSGVVIADEGYILTNNHVISMAADQPEASINVYFVDGSISPAEIVGRDPMSDLAVIKVDKPGLVPIDIGSSQNVAVGDQVVAFGSPLGLAGTVTSGIVSALDRPVYLAGAGADTDAYILAVQTDASINPGNSGGALVDDQGALIGINTAIASFSTAGGQAGSIGLGFAIPVDFAMSIANTIITGGEVKHGSLGINAQSVSDGTTDGVLVVRADPESPAAQAGIKEKDVIIEANGVRVGSVEDINAVTYSHQPGDTIELTVISGGEQKTVQVVLGEA